MRSLTKPLGILFVVGLLVFLMGYLFLVNQPTFLYLMFIFGMFGFIPMGMMLGALFFNPYNRCKIWRVLTKKNWGILRLVVDKHTQDIIVNLDNDSLDINSHMFTIQRGRMFYDTGTKLSDGSKVPQQIPITSREIKYSAGVPTIYFDINSITPLVFHDDKIKISPQELSASIKAYVINKEAELMQLKKGVKLSIYGIIIAIAISIMLTWNLYQYVQKDIMPLLQEINGKLGTGIQPNIVVQGG